MSGIPSIVDTLNHNKYFTGILMLLMNLGARYIEQDLSISQKNIFNTVIMRRFMIFTIAFIATRDVISSLIITACFIIFVLNLFNTKSNYCVLPKYFYLLDENKDGIISEKEIKNAVEIIKKYKNMELDKKKF